VHGARNTMVKRSALHTDIAVRPSSCGSICEHVAPLHLATIRIAIIDLLKIKKMPPDALSSEVLKHLTQSNRSFP
jgi:hypothetical protein